MLTTLLDLQWESSSKTWSPKNEPSKTIPYIEEKAWVNGDYSDGDYSIEVSIWSRTVNVKVLYWCGEDNGIEDRWVSAMVLYKNKFSRADWEDTTNRNIILRQCLKVIEEDMEPTPTLGDCPSWH